jgi:integrase
VRHHPFVDERDEHLAKRERSGEVFGMTWDEVDLDAKIWVVARRADENEQGACRPAQDAAVPILRGQNKTRRKNPFVLPSPRPRQPLSNMSMAMVMRPLATTRRTISPAVPRLGCRSWSCFEVAEACLAHAVGNAVTRAYLRTTMLERRQKVLMDWAAFLSGESEGAKVVRSRANAHDDEPHDEAQAHS